MTAPNVDPQATTALRRLADHFAVSEVLDRYARVLDDRTFSATLPTLFTSDAQVRLPNRRVHGGIDGLDHFHIDVVSPFGRTQHIFTNYLIDVTGHQGAFRANTLATHHLPRVDPGIDNLFVAGESSPELSSEHPKAGDLINSPWK
jgi:hypothetical protein